MGSREAGRILLVDEADRVLLVRFWDGDRSWWCTPGGGIEPGETDGAAALREIREELGGESIEFGPCIWTRRHIGVFRGRPFDQCERIYPRYDGFADWYDASIGVFAEAAGRDLLGSGAGAGTVVRPYRPKDASAMKPPEALLFDLDDTLIDERELHGALMQTCSTLASLQNGLDARRLFDANQEVWRAYWPDVEGKWTLGLLDGATLSLEAWRRTLRACGCIDESLAKLAVEALSGHTRAAYRPYEDVLQSLGALKGLLSLGLITNGASDTQRQRLGWFDLEQHFGVIVISGEVGVAKPDPAIFGLALDKLAVSPDRAWYVGDSLHTDVAGAKAAGLTAVWLNRHGSTRKSRDLEPDLEIESLTELFTVFAETE